MGEDRSITVRVGFAASGDESRGKGHGGKSWLGDWALASSACSDMVLVGNISEGTQVERISGRGSGRRGGEGHTPTCVVAKEPPVAARMTPLNKSNISAATVA